MSKGGSQTVHQRLDPATQAYVNQMRQLAMGGGAPQTQSFGPGGSIRKTFGAQGGGQFGGAVGTALGGPQGGGSWFTGPLSGQDIQAAMNPYLQNVVGGVRGEFDFLRDQALTGANQQATMSNAFGGSRHGVMAGSRLGELDRAQSSQIANLLQSGYSDARGFAEHQRQLAQQQLQEPLFRHQQALQFAGAGMGPYGTSTTQPMQGNLLGGLAGGALAGLGLAGEGGALAGLGAWPAGLLGAGLGLFGSIF